MPSPTYLTGIYTAPRGYIKLRNVYRRTLLLLKKIPKEAAYRVNTEAFICHRLNVVQEAGDDIKEIEENLNGKLEILLLQAQAELNLCQNMMVWKPWEKLMEQPPPGQWDWPPANV